MAAGTRSIALLALPIALVAGCGDAPQGRARNVLLVSIDTCRADRLGCYGESRPTSPNLDALAAEGALFLEASSTNPITLPSHSSMLTGTLPPVHGVLDNKFHLDQDNRSLAEVLSERGFAAAAFVSAFVLDSRFGLDQGFDPYDDELAEFGSEAEGDNWRINERRAGDTTDAALAWLEDHHRAPFFAFVHYFDPHASYDPPEPFASRFPGAPYEGEIAYVDAQIGRLLAGLERFGRADDTLVIVTADHGESFGEHGEDTHSYFVYQSTIHVPLIVRAPGGVAGVRVEEPVSLVDLAPTVLALTGVAREPAMGGRDLTPFLDGAPAGESAAPVYAETLYPTLYRCAALRAVRRGRWKYVWTVRPELYDLERDPGELENVVAEAPQVAAELERELRALLEERRERGGSQALDRESLERIQALGYAEGAVEVSYDLDPDANDAKDFLEVHNDLLAVHMKIADGDLDEAYGMCRAMTEAHPWLLEAHGMLGGIRFEEGRFEEAAGHYEDYLTVVDAELAEAGNDAAARLEPGLVSVLVALGDTYAELERREAAEASYRRALELAPDDFWALSGYAAYLGQRQRRFEDAIALLRRAVAIEPRSAEAQGNLGNCLYATGALEEAVEHYRAALAAEPDAPEVQFNLGSALYDLGRHAEAVVPLTAAGNAAPGNPDVQRALGLSLACAGRLDEARAALARAVRAGPPALERLRREAMTLAAHAESSARRPEAALAVARVLAEATGERDPAVLDLLAVARAANGDFQGAVESAERALDLGAGLTPEVRARLERRLVLYRDGKAFRRPAKGNP